MTDVYVGGRSRDAAILLLAAAEDLGLDGRVVRTTTNGYLVPEEVADKSGLGPSEENTSGPVTKAERTAEPDVPKQEPAKKAPVKKAPAKKTAAKRTAAKKTPAKKTPAKKAASAKSDGKE